MSMSGLENRIPTSSLRQFSWWILVSLLLPTLGLGAEVSIEDWRIDRKEWTFELKEAKSVSLDNTWGDIRVRTLDKNEAYLLINAQRHKDDPREMEVKVVEEEGRLTLKLHYPEGGVEEIPEAWSKRRIDATLMIPAATEANLKTDKGLLEARGLSGAVEAESSRGEIRMRAKGAVRATNEHGRIYIQYLKTGWDRPSALETVTGNIRVEFPQGGRAEVDLETRGEITTDYSIAMDREDGKQLKKGKVSVAEGGNTLSLKSNRGAIALIASLISEN